MTVATTQRGGPPRKHPQARIGDRFGARTVIATIEPGARGRSDERVRWKCICGAIGESYVFNLRGRALRCTHGGKPAAERRTVRFEDVCVCEHARGDHQRNRGECLEDDCDCAAFDSAAERVGSR